MESQELEQDDPPAAVPGLRLVRTLGGFEDLIGRLAWSADGELLATPSRDGSVGIWKAESGELIQRLPVRLGKGAWTVAFSPDGLKLAVGYLYETALFAPHDGSLIKSLASGRDNNVLFAPGEDRLAIATKRQVGVHDGTSGDVIWSAPKSDVAGLNNNPGAAFSPDGRLLAVGGNDNEATIYDHRGRVQGVVRHFAPVIAVAVSPDGRLLASADGGGIIKITLLASYQVVTELEGHTRGVTALSFAPGGELLASRSHDGTTRLWDTRAWAVVGVVHSRDVDGWLHGVAFHPRQPLLATVNSDDYTIDIWHFDLSALLGQSTRSPVQYVSAKIVLVGDSGVGKTGLGWRMAHGEFKDHASTHGQHFWLLSELGTTRSDGAECEAILWDLAGQPDYRLIHALFLDDADLALLVFDPTRADDPLRAVEYWLRQLRVHDGRPGPAVILVAARSDRGGPVLTEAEMAAFSARRGIAATISTSALSGAGVDELIALMRSSIAWDERPRTVTTEVFKQIKDYVLALKEAGRPEQLIVSPAELRARMEHDGIAQGFADAEMTVAVRHLANHGYVTWLRNSTGARSVLLVPELLNNLGASIVLEARRNPLGLGSLEEQRLLAGDYRLPELADLSPAEQALLLDSAVAMFLSHNVCFRSTDLLNGRTYLVFPDLINMQRPTTEGDVPLDEGVSYSVVGPVENVYASLVVVLGYTSTFTRTDQWRNHARYVMGDNLICDLRVESEKDGELTLVLSFGTDVGSPVRTLFQSLVESLLARRDLTVRRYAPVMCSKGHQLHRSVAREQLAEGNEFAFCNRCGERMGLPRANAPIELTRQQADSTAAERRTASDRTRFEEAVFRLNTYVTQSRLTVPACFISYAWGNPDEERWVEQSLASDLAKAGLPVILDRWENARIGASVARFVERMDGADRIIVVGTPGYQTKYTNAGPTGSFVVAAEGDLLLQRMVGTEEQKKSVLPVLLDGDVGTSLPPLLRGRVYADFRDPTHYFGAAFDLMLSIYRINPQDPPAAELRPWASSWQEGPVARR